MLQIFSAALAAGIDQRINDLVTPVSNMISGLVFMEIGAGGLHMPFIVLWLLVGAVFFTLRMGFINIRGFAQAIRIARGTYDDPRDPGEVTHFQALSAALSGTVGLGNIAGVALAISIGGPGATFWMIMAGLFGMSSKFTECTLAVHYRIFDADGRVTGGPMIYLRDGLAERGLPRLGRFLAGFSAILCIGGAIGAGAMVQINQSGRQFSNVMTGLVGSPEHFLASPIFYGLCYMAVVALVIVGGIRSISRVTSRLVPLMAAIYVGAALLVLGTHASAIPHAVVEIVAGAFNWDAGVGAMIGTLVQGLRRATFSNEAGIGSAAIAHAAAKTREPVAEGLVALLEPFIDTVVICTITALVIIVTGQHQVAGLDGVTLTSRAFATVIDWFPYVLMVAVVLFAFSTSISWYYYGERCFSYLCGNRKWPHRLFQMIYLGLLFTGASMTMGAVFDFGDAMLLGMAFPNMIGLYLLSSKVKAMLDSYLDRHQKGEIRPYLAPAE